MFQALLNLTGLIHILQRLSDAIYFSNSSDESTELPLPQKKRTNFFKLAKARSPAFPNDLHRYKPKLIV